MEHLEYFMHGLAIVTFTLIPLAGFVALALFAPVLALGVFATIAIYIVGRLFWGRI